MSARLSHFFADVARIHRMSGSLRTWIVNLLLIPALVAASLVVVFVNRGFPQDSISSFIFFSTLYLFWSGVFLSCRAVNGAVESGEWAYWVLGIRRSVSSYVLAMVIQRLFMVFLSVVSFWGVVWAAVVFFCPGAWTVAIAGSYMQPYVYDLSHGTFEVCDVVASLLTDLEPGKELSLQAGLSEFAQWTFLGYYAWGLTFAGISGVVLGTLFSAIFGRTQQSVAFSVGFLMVVMVVSFLSFKPTRESVVESVKNESYRLGLMETPTFPPVLYEWHARRFWGETRYRTVCRVPDGECEYESYPFMGVLQVLSHFLPQRYFFNLAHVTVPRLGYLSRGCYDGRKNRLRTTWPKRESENGGFLCDWSTRALEMDGGQNVPTNAEGRRRYCWCVFCLDLVPRTWCERDTQGNGSFWLHPGEALPRRATEKDVQAFRASIAWDRAVLADLWLRTAACETAVLGLLLLLTFFIFCIFLKKPSLRTLR